MKVIQFAEKSFSMFKFCLKYMRARLDYRLTCADKYNSKSDLIALIYSLAKPKHPTPFEKKSTQPQPNRTGG